MRKYFLLSLVVLSFLYANDEALKRKEAIEFFKTQKSVIFLPKELKGVYDEILRLAEKNNGVLKDKKITIFVLTSFSLMQKTNFNQTFESQAELLRSRGGDFQSAYVFRGLPSKEDISEFFFKVAGLKKDPRQIIKIIESRAEKSGMDPKTYMETQAKELNLSVQDYAKGLYEKEIGMPKNVKTIIKIIPRLFKKLNVKEVPAYVIGVCPKFDEDFDLDDCELDSYALGDSGLETFLKYASMHNNDFNDLYYKMIGGF